jgi:hypothetical protein
MNLRLFALIILFALASCGQTPKSNATAQHDDDLTSSVRHQVESHWAVNPGLPDIERFAVVVRVELAPDGAVRSVSIIEDLARMKNDANYRAFAQSTLRAVERASPLKIPASAPYEAWKVIIMTFGMHQL